MNQEYKQPILSIEGLSTGYNKKIISKNLSIELGATSLTALIGLNGTGKSTLLNAIAFGDTILKGKIFIDGKNASQLKQLERSKLISIVKSHLKEEVNLSVEELVSLGRSPYLSSLGKLSMYDRNVIRNAILSCKLKGFEKRKITSLSDGERQRALIAMAIAQETPLVILDEPTSHLDITFRIKLFMLLRELSIKSKVSFLLATHEVSLAMQWCDNIWIIDNEGSIQVGLPEELALNGNIDSLFQQESFSFDPYSGQIEISNKNKRPIKTIYHNSIERNLWTDRLLHRLGYFPSPQGEYTLEVKSCTWKITTNSHQIETDSLKELQSILRRDF